MKDSQTFWGLMTMHFLSCACQGIVLIYIVPTVIHSGIDAMSASGILSALVAVGAVTRFFGPIIADRLGGKITVMVALFFQSAPILMLLWATELWQFYLVVATFAIGFGCETPVMPILIRQFFGRGPMGRPIGCQDLVDGLGIGLGVLAGGMLFTAFGSYDYAVMLGITACLVGAAVTLPLRPLERSLHTAWEKDLPIEARSREFFNSYTMRAASSPPSSKGHRSLARIVPRLSFHRS